MNKYQTFVGRSQGGSGRIALWIVTGGLFVLIFVGLIVGVVFVVKMVVSDSYQSAAFNRIEKTLDKVDAPQTSREVSRLDPKEGGLYGGLPSGARITLESAPPNMDKAAREIAEDIEHLPDYCRKLSASGSDRASRRLALLSGLIPKFTGNVAVEPLLRMPAGCPTYDPSLTLVNKRMSQKGLIESACADDAAVRQFSARVLAMRMPFGKLDGPSEAELAVRTSTVEKQQTFDRLYAAAHQAIESRLVGRYRLQIDAVWKTAEQVESPVRLTTQQTIVDVSCTGRTWAIKLGDQAWSGVIDDLARAKLRTPFSSIVPEASGMPGLRPDTELSLSGGETSLSVAISPVAGYQPLREVQIGTSRHVTRYEPAKDGYEKLTAILVR